MTLSQSGMRVQQMAQGLRAAQQRNQHAHLAGGIFFQLRTGFRRGQRIEDTPDPDRIGGAAASFCQSGFFIQLNARSWERAKCSR